MAIDRHSMRRWAYGRLSDACAAAGARMPSPMELNRMPMSELLERIERLEEGAGQLCFGNHPDTTPDSRGSSSVCCPESGLPGPRRRQPEAKIHSQTTGTFAALPRA